MNTEAAIMAAAQALLASSMGTGQKPNLLLNSFPEQRAFVEDQAPMKAAQCTRRAAKSFSVGLEQMGSAMEGRWDHLIIGLTRPSVKDNCWDKVLKAINRKWDLGFIPNETELEMRCPRTGGLVKLLGMDANDSEKRKALGGKRKKIAIDEAQDFHTNLEDLVYKVLGPSVIDHDGQITLCGTPGDIPRGLFFEVTNGKRNGWSVHKWSTSQNTMVPEGETERVCDRAAKKIAQLKADNPRVVEVPWFRQMYLNEWVTDDTKKCYRFNEDRNIGLRDPSNGWCYVLGIDLGYNDPTAFVVCAYHQYERCLYILEAHKEAGLDITAVAEKIRGYMARFDFERLIIDNANKQAVEEMKHRHELPLMPADKAGKSDFIELMNGDFIIGNIKLDAAKCAPLIEEYGGLIWDEKALENRKKEEHPACPNHCADAALYAWRFCYPYLSTVKPKVVQPGTTEWQQAQQDEMRQMAEQEIMQRREQQWEQEQFG